MDNQQEVAMRLILKRGLSLFAAAILAVAFICPASIAENADPILIEAVTHPPAKSVNI